MSWIFVLVMVVAALAAWGLHRATDAEAFFVASRRAGPVLAGLAGTAAGLSAFVFVGGPGLFAAAGTASLWIILSSPLTGALQCWAVGEPVVELGARHRCLTVPELVAARFGDGSTRALAAATIILGAVAMLAVQARGAALLADVLLPIPGWAAAVLVLGATAVYTAAGGMRLGLPLEAAQGTVMGVVAVLLTVSVVRAAGGPVTAWERLAELKPELVGPWGATGAVTALGWFVLFGLGTCAQPHYVQKFLMLRDPSALRWLPLVSTVALATVLTVWLGVGLGGTSLASAGRLAVGTPDALTSVVLQRLVPPGLRDVALIAVAFAVMSTATSLLNIAAAALTRDLPAAFGREVLGLTSARIATAGVAGAALVVGLAWSRALVLLGVLGWGTFTAALLPVLVLGLNWHGARRAGAVAALAAGPAVQLTLEALRPVIPALAPWQPGLTGAAAGTVLLVVLSIGSERSLT